MADSTQFDAGSIDYKGQKPEVLAAWALKLWSDQIFSREPTGVALTEKEQKIFEAAKLLMEAVDPDELPNEAKEWQKRVADMESR